MGFFLFFFASFFPFKKKLVVLSCIDCMDVFWKELEVEKRIDLNILYGKFEKHING